MPTGPAGGDVYLVNQSRILDDRPTLAGVIGNIRDASPTIPGSSSGYADIDRDADASDHPLVVDAGWMEMLPGSGLPVAPEFRDHLADRGIDFDFGPDNTARAAGLLDDDWPPDSWEWPIPTPSIPGAGSLPIRWIVLGLVAAAGLWLVRPILAIASNTTDS